jgi:hypothetical protein
LQKLANLKLSFAENDYLVPVEYIGENNGMRLVDTSFEAWNLGPVSSELYHKDLWPSPVRNVFFDAKRFRENDGRRSKLIDICNKYLGETPGKLMVTSKNTPSARKNLFEFDHRERVRWGNWVSLI